MKVFLSYALSPEDGALSARLRAVALAYNIELLLPDIDGRQFLAPNNKKKIKDSNAVLILISHNRSFYRPTNYLQPLTYQSELQAVQLELNEAVRLNRPIIALVEDGSLIHGLLPNQVILFDRHNPAKHEGVLFAALAQIQAKKNAEDLVKALGALGLVALGFLALSEFTKDASGEK